MCKHNHIHIPDVTEGRNTIVKLQENNMVAFMLYCKQRGENTSAVLLLKKKTVFQQALGSCTNNVLQK